MYGIYLGRFQPFHKGHLKTDKIAKSQYGIEDSLFVIFNYTPFIPSYSFPFSKKEQEEMVRALGINTVFFDINLESGYLRHLLPHNFLKKWMELRRIGGKNEKRYITRDRTEFVILSFLFLHPLYIPFGKDERVFRSSNIKKLICEGRIEEVIEMIPENREYRRKFLEIVKNKDWKKIPRSGYEIFGLKIPPRI
ncbi:MAG: hypothetical protein QXX38_00055 [Candidatus Aenigmatarchaeota archaeon]